MMGSGVFDCEASIASTGPKEGLSHSGSGQ